MKLSKKLSNLIDKLATLPEALDYVCDSVEALEVELKTERELRQNIALEKLQLQEQINKLQTQLLDMMKAEQQNVHLSEIKNRAKYMADKLQISESAVWGCYVDACRKAVVWVDAVVPEPTEPKTVMFQDEVTPCEIVGFTVEKKPCVPKLEAKYKDSEGNIWQCHMVKEDKVGLNRKSILGQIVEWTMPLSDFQTQFEPYE